tara:strand:+ start:259 stop:1089 length:831 start_codon:yes stop_codon:yes gene_type:complete
MKKKLVVSFSGGETSAFLAKWLIDKKQNIYDMIFIFANTGDEEEETLIFIEKCSKEWGISIVWVEAVVHHNERVGSTHKEVDFKTASRNREPFKEVIKKYGIPNQNFLHCNREMKLAPIKSYIKSIGWKKYETAIGIRVDEFDRMNKHKDKLGLIYPLIKDNPTTKQEISYWWDNQKFRLKLKSYNTNCRTCWKKSDKVLAEIYRLNPDYFDFNKEMEKKYGKEKYVFFRNGRSTEELIKDLNNINSKPRDKHKDINFQTDLFSESCDIYSLCGDN